MKLETTRPSLGSIRGPYVALFNFHTNKQDKQIPVNLQTDIQLLINNCEKQTKEQGSKKILNFIQLVVYLTITRVLLDMTYIAYQAVVYGLN